MIKSDSIANLTKALSEFQAEVTNPANTATNPFFKSKYAPLNEILALVRPILGKYGLSIIQEPSTAGTDVIVKTILTHASGEFIESDPLTLKMEKVTAQGAGSAITYARRYAISAILGLSSEDDDDGNRAEDSGKKSDSNQKKSKPETRAQPSDELKAVITEINTLATEKAKINRDAVLDVIKKHHANGNPNSIRSMDIANSVLTDLKGLEV